MWLTTAWSAHWVEKFDEHRERYANFILPTLLDPYQVWWTRYSDGTMRSRYIGLFTGRSDLAAVVRRNPDGSVLWNVMQASLKDMNRHRRGWLLYTKEEGIGGASRLE